MLALHQLFLINFSLIFVFTFVLSSVISYNSVKKIELNSYEDHLKKHIMLMEIELDGVDNLQDFAKKVYEKSEIRVAMINKDGRIVASSIKPKMELIEHMDAFEELKNANNSGFGSSLRHSHDDGSESLFVAKKTAYKGEELYIRASVDTGKIMEDSSFLWSRLVLVFTVSFCIGMLMASAINSSFKTELDKITKYLGEISEKNYNAKLYSSFSKEFVILGQLLQKLAKKLEKRDRKLRKNSAMLRLKNRQNSEIVSAISHEFKNPIAIILGYSQTLSKDDGLNESIKKRFLEKIANNANKINTLIDRLSIFAKLENQTLGLNKSTFNIYSSVREVANMLEEKYKNRKVEITGQTRFVEADKTLIELVLVNLIENALKYSEESVKVGIKSSAIEVMDAGIGISEEDLGLITKKFYRVDENKWNNSLGLGLPIVKYILELHGSRLNIESKFGEGSKFWFNI